MAVAGPEGFNPFTPEQEAELRALLGLRDGEELTGAMVLLALETNRVLTAELDYLATALRIGWARWTIDDTPPLG